MQAFGSLAQVTYKRRHRQSCSSCPRSPTCPKEHCGTSFCIPQVQKVASRTLYRGRSSFLLHEDILVHKRASVHSAQECCKITEPQRSCLLCGWPEFNPKLCSRTGALPNLPYLIADKSPLSKRGCTRVVNWSHCALTTYCMIRPDP